MSHQHARRYSGRNEKHLLAQVQADNPDGFEILSITQLGFGWWRKTVVMVRPLVSTAPQEMRTLRLVSAIYAQRERRHQQAAQQDVMSHAHDSKHHHGS